MIKILLLLPPLHLLRGAPEIANGSSRVYRKQETIAQLDGKAVPAESTTALPLIKSPFNTEKALNIYQQEARYSYFTRQYPAGYQ